MPLTQISLDPLGHGPLRAALQAAVAAALATSGWLLLDAATAVECNPLTALPGDQGGGSLVQFDVGVQEPATLLVFLRRATSVRFRRWSPAAALAVERAGGGAALPPALASAAARAGGRLDDGALLADPLLLRAAARALEGRPVKLLPDQE